MHTEQTARLAAEGAEALLTAMPTPTWPVLREEAVELLQAAGPALEGELVPELDVNARMLAAAGPEHVAVLRDMLASRWSENLLRVLAASPGADEAVRRLVERIGAAVPAVERAGKTMTNIAKDRATLFAVMDGNIIQHHHPKPGSREKAAADGDGDDGGRGGEVKEA